MKKNLHFSIFFKYCIIVLFLVTAFVQAQTSINSTPVTTAIVGSSYSSPITAVTNTNNPISFSTVGTLPSFLTLGTGGSSQGVQIGNSTIANASAVASDTNGNYYVVQFSSNSIFKVTSGGVITPWATKTQSGVAVYGGAVVVGDYLYVGYRNNSNMQGGIMRYDITSSSPVGVDVVPPGAATFFNLTYRNGFIYAGDYSRSKIIKVDLNNSYAVSDVVNVPQASGCAFDSAGNMYITSPDGMKLWKYTTSGQLINTGLTFSNYPFDVEIDAYDNVYVGTRDQGIRKYTSDLSSYVTINNSVGTYIWGISFGSTGILSWAITNQNKAYQLQTGATISGTPAIGDIGTYNITTTATDGTTSNQQTYTLSVYGPATLGIFTDVTKYTTDSTFNLTDPTSNSPGTFTYTSSNTAVATISGNTVTIQGAGSATITATQAANGLYLQTTKALMLTVTAPTSSITTSATSLSAMSTCTGTPSAENSFTISGSNLTASVIASAPADFEVSLTSGSGYTSSVTIPASGTLSTTTVYLRLSSTATAGAKSGNITLASTGATSQSVAVTGTVTALPVAPTSITTINYCQGVSATALTATATSGNTLKWYTVATGGIGSTTAITPTTSTSGTINYYVSQVNSSGCEGPRTEIAVSTSPLAAVGLATTAASSVCSGSTTTISLASNSGSIQWQQLMGSTWNDITGETSTTLITPSITQGTSFRAKVSSGSCTAVYSNIINIALSTPPLAAGYGLDFDGSNDLITIPNSSTYNYTTSSAFTIEAWVKINASATSINTIVGKKTPGGGSSGYAFYINSWGTSDRKVVFETTTGTFVSTTSISNNTWTHVAVSVASGGTATIYINGVASGTGNITIPSNSNTLNIGAFGNNNYFYFNGSLDEVRVWDVAKSATELNNYKNTDVTGASNLALYYKFNEGTGSIVNDKSTNLNNGSLVNFALAGSTSNWVSSNFQDTAVITGNSRMCIGSTTSLTHAVSGGTWTSASTNVATIDPSTGVVTGVAVGTSVINYNYTYNGCTFSDTFTLTVNVLPVAPTAITTINYCQGSTASALIATATSGNTLKWYTVATGGSGSTTAITPTTSTSGAINYYVSQVNSSGCESSRTTITVAVNTSPVISGNTTVGKGEIITLTATTTPANSNVWVSSNPAVATVSSLGVVSGLTLGTASITYTNSNGCSVSSIITVVNGATQLPVLTSPSSNTTGATTLQVNYTLPETPLAGSVRLLFTPISGGSPIIWTMNNNTAANFAYVVGNNPTTISNVVSGAALAFTTYNITISYQDAYANPVASVTNNNIQTLAPPSITLPQTNFTGAANINFNPFTIQNSGGPSTYTISPALPNGLILNTVTGEISGRPTAPLTNTSFTITASNAAGTTTISFRLFIDQDTDGDGILNAVDTDDDGDGILDVNDAFPLNRLEWTDTDHDGIGNNADTDDDNDGILDTCEFQIMAPI
jgi:hypothetical protein